MAKRLGWGLGLLLAALIAGLFMTIEHGLAGEDEVGELADAFNEMTRKLRDTTVSRDYLDRVLETMGECLVAAPEIRERQTQPQIDNKAVRERFEFLCVLSARLFGVGTPLRWVCANVQENRGFFAGPRLDVLG